MNTNYGIPCIEALAYMSREEAKAFHTARLRAINKEINAEEAENRYQKNKALEGRYFVYENAYNSEEKWFAYFWVEKVFTPQEKPYAERAQICWLEREVPGDITFQYRESCISMIEGRQEITREEFEAVMLYILGNVPFIKPNLPPK